MTTVRTRFAGLWIVACVLLLLLFESLPCRAQDGDISTPDSVYASPGRVGLGLRAGGVHFSGDLRNALDFAGASVPFRIGGDFFIHTRLLQATQGENAMRIGLEAAAGYRFLSAAHPLYAFNTKAYPFSASVTVEFNSRAIIRPSISVGIGGIPYNLQIIHNTLSGTRAKQVVAEGSNVIFWMPLRVGLRAAISPALDLQLTLERSVTLSDRLDGIVTKDLDWMNDNFEMISFGFTCYFLGNRTADPYGEQILPPVVVVPPPPDPAYTDSDDDGLMDAEETNVFHTDPRNSDSDGDGLSDGQEIKRYRTNPLLDDTDGDGIRDDEEVRLKTNPNDRDSDGDKIPDGSDKCPTEAGPMSNLGCPYANDRGDLIFEKLGDILILENIEFEAAKATLLPTSNPTLDKVVRSLKDNPNVEIEVRGHTDSTGDYKQNVALSLKRAESVKQYLVSRGIASMRITTDGLGPAAPIAPNNTSEGRQRNRRIEFRIVKFE
jgi:outer membrane protein OmpA-like peptidoglycan-associated protein